MAALGAAPLAFDDHPGQLYRLWHVATRGPAPWAWNPDWWAGYPELQFYPPGLAYAGALLHWVSFTTLSVPASYHALVWIAYLAPGPTTFFALERVLGSGWLALPGSFLALTLSAGTASGVEGGVHVGMVGARLAWALVPLLLLVLVPWIEEDRPLPWSAALLVAAIVVTHPAQLPAAVVLIVLAAVARPPRAARLATALAGLVLAAALTAFWTWPLVLRLEHTRALAWGGPPGLGGFGWMLVLVALLGLWRARAGGRAALVVALYGWAMGFVTLLDRFALEPLGARFLPANRVADGAWIPLVTAPAPVFAERAIVHGTFTHPSPIAALIYRGDAGPGPITRLAEQLDGRSLFGRPLESLDPETFNGFAEGLGISVVVALDEDASRLRALDDNRAFAKREAPPPFLIYIRRDGADLPRPIAPDRWTITLAADRDVWVSTRTAYYPLWRASVQGAPLETRRGRLGDLEVRLRGSGSPPAVVDLSYGPGTPEISGIVVSVVGGVVWLAVSRRRGKRRSLQTSGS